MVGQVAGCRVCGRPLPVFTVKRARLALCQLVEILDPEQGEWPAGDDAPARREGLAYARRALAWADGRCVDCAETRQT